MAVTKEQVLDVLSKTHAGSNGIRIVYKKELPLAKRHPNYKNLNPAEFYRVVTRQCISKVKYYNTKSGKNSLAAGNAPADPPHFHKSSVPGENEIYYSNKDTSESNPAVRLYPTHSNDEIRYFAQGKEITRADVEDLIKQGVLRKDALSGGTTDDYIIIYVATLINISATHGKGKDMDKGNPNEITSASEYHESLDLTEASLNNIANMPMMSADETHMVSAQGMVEDMNEEVEVNEDYGWEISSDDAWDAFEEVREILGDEELCLALAKAMGNEELADLLAYICRNYDLEIRALGNTEDDEEDFEFDDNTDDISY